MELLFLYTRRFRNLEQVEFNFSNKKRVNFETQNNRLSITEDPNYRKNFFGSRISNVTGIVGVNGAGKSNLLELIGYLSKGPSTRYENFIIVFEDTDGTYVYKSNIPGLELPKNSRYIESGKSIPYFSTIFFSNIADGREHHFPKDLIDVSAFSTVKNTKSRSDAYNQLKFVLSDAYNRSDLERPSSLLLSLRTDLTLKRGITERLQPDSIFLKVISRYKQGFAKSKPTEQFRYGLRYSVFFYLLNHVFQHYPEFERNPQRRSEEHCINRFEEIGSRFLSGKLDSVQDIHIALKNFLQNFLFDFQKVGEIQTPELGKYLNFDEQVERLGLEVSSQRISRRSYFQLQFNRTNRNLLREYSVIFDFPEIMEIDWAGISSGHRAFLNLYSQIYATQRRLSQSDQVLILIDEGDLYLHPEWQREFLMRLLNFLPRALDKTFQLILTTHSPFLISDLPKENIILLSRNNQQDKLQRTDIDIRQTFGANIHELYRGPFVLKGAKISAFALQKIKHAISLLSHDQLNQRELNEIRDIISAVGDEPVYRKLQEMLRDAEN